MAGDQSASENRRIDRHLPGYHQCGRGATMVVSFLAGLTVIRPSLSRACYGYDLRAGMPSRTGAAAGAWVTGAATLAGGMAAACQESPARVRRTDKGAASDRR